MVKDYLVNAPGQKKYILICSIILISIGISFSQDEFNKSKKNTSWQIILKNKEDNSGKILTDTFVIDLTTNTGEAKTLKYISNSYITGLEKRRGLSYTIAIYNNFYKKRIIHNIEQYFYKPVIITMKPLSAKVNITVKDVTQKINNDYQVIKLDSFTVQKDKFPINYSIASFLDTTLWTTVNNSGILSLKDVEKTSNENLLLSYDILVDRMSQVKNFTIRINESVSSRPPAMYYDIIGFNANDSKIKEKVPNDIIKFKANFPTNPLESDKIQLLFYNSENFFFSNANSQTLKPWIPEVCTLVITTPDSEHSINLSQLPNFDFLYIASYKLEKRLRLFEYLNTLLKDISQHDYFLYLSNNTTPVYCDNTQQFQPILQNLLENEYDPPEINHDLTTISSIINFDELIPQRRTVTFHFFFTSYINDKTIEGIIQPLMQKVGTQMQYIKMNIYCSDKKDFEFFKNLSENERKNVSIKVF